MIARAACRFRSVKTTFAARLAIAGVVNAEKLGACTYARAAISTVPPGDSPGEMD